MVRAEVEIRIEAIEVDRVAPQIFEYALVSEVFLADCGESFGEFLDCHHAFTMVCVLRTNVQEFAEIGVASFLTEIL